MTIAQNKANNDNRFPLRHDTGGRDYRYSITAEFCGHATAQHVVRYCDEWIGSRPDYKSALCLALAARRDNVRKFNSELDAIANRDRGKN